MLVRFLCPACHQLLGIAPRKVGAQVNCPKCGATILVPDPEEPPAADIVSPDFAVPDGGAAGTAGGESAAADTAAPDTATAGSAGENIATSTESPSDALGFDILADVAAYERPRGGAGASQISRKHRPAAELPLDDGERIVISRRVLYFQAVLLAVVGLLALVAGYLIGSGARLHGP